jgi:hypothetical protein
VGELLDERVAPWMTADNGAGAVRRAVEALQADADRLRSVATRLGGLLGSAAATLGWKGDAALAASGAADHGAGQVRQALDVVGDTTDAMRRLADGMDEHGQALRDLRQRATRALVELLDPFSADHDAAKRQVEQLTTQASGHVDALLALDAAVAAALGDAAARLRTLSALVAEDGWIATAAAPGVLSFLALRGVVDSTAQQELLARAAALPAGAQGRARLRELLAALPPAAAAALLERHPELAGRLLGGLPPASELPPGSPEAGLLAALGATYGLAPQERVAAVRAFFAGMTPEQAQRLAVLYPDAVGNLDGAPLDARVTANRLRVAVELDVERARHTAFVLAAEGAPGWEKAYGRFVTDGWPAMVVHVDSDQALLERSSQRIAYYERLLDEEFVNPAPAPGRPDAVLHQVVYFDPAGDGRIAEMFGRLDASTRHVAVFVPGTGARMENMAGYSDSMRLLARDCVGPDGLGSTTTIAWLGMDAPDAVVHDAPFRDYAERGGPALRDFVAGLGVPPGADSTVIGHSYGGATVGVADRAGLDVDRVLMVESAGAGNGVWSVGDYREAETGRDIDHYTITAPNDPITFARTDRALQELSGLGHGGDPDTMAGFTRLESGRFALDHPDPARRGRLVEGHSDPMARGTTSWDNMVAVSTGSRVTPWTPPTLVDDGWGVSLWPPTIGPEKRLVHPYADPAYPGTPLVDIP